MILFQLSKTYNFDTMAPSEFGATIKNAKLLSVLDYTEARKQSDIDTVYRNVLPLLPPGTPNHVSSTVYYKFVGENNSTFLMAEEWVDSTSIVEVNSISVVVDIPNLDVSDIPVIRDSLNAVGVTNFVIRQV